MFKVNDYVIYKRDVCIILEEKLISNYEYFVLQSTIDDSLKINIPKNITFDEISIDSGAGSIKIDSISAQKLDLDLGAGKLTAQNLTVLKQTNIEEDYKRCLRDETLESLIAIIKTSYFRNQSRLAHNKKMTDKDKYYYELAEKFLYNEIAYIYNTTYEDAKKYVLDKLN